jgi:hypothetical protein
MLELLRILRTLHPGFWIGLVLVALPLIVSAAIAWLDGLPRNRLRLKH